MALKDILQARYLPGASEYYFKYFYGQPMTLHYGYDMTPQSQSIQPYFFRGDMKWLDVSSREGVTIYTARFANVR